jgi:drug/metabolite transporter (DMT)-like permease
MIFAGGWAWVLRGETQDAVGIAGMALILVSGTVIALRSRARTG